MLGNSSKKNSTTHSLMSTEETREYLNQISKHPRPSADVMPERRIMSVDETREYLNHISKQPATNVDKAQAQSLAIGKGKL